MPKLPSRHRQKIVPSLYGAFRNAAGDLGLSLSSLDEIFKNHGVFADTAVCNNKKATSNGIQVRKSVERQTVDDRSGPRAGAVARISATIPS